MIQLFKPTVSLKWESQENTQVPCMEEEASWKWQFWEQVREFTASSALSAKMLKQAGYFLIVEDPPSLSSVGNAGNSLEIGPSFSNCSFPFVTWQLSSLQGCSVTQRPGLHPSSCQDLPARRQVGALGCCGRSHWAHPSLKLSQWRCGMRITKHWDKSPGERGESLGSGVFKTQLTAS